MSATIDYTKDVQGSLRWTRAINAMAQNGGSFAKALAGAFRAADSANHARLMTAFADIYRAYVEFTSDDAVPDETECDYSKHDQIKYDHACGYPD